MIIRKKENWFRMLFIWHGSVLPALLPRLLILFTLSLLIAYFHGTVFSFKIPLNTTPLTLFGFVLALFLGFRNNVSYERFWEGRKLWGALLNISRSLVRQALTLGDTNKASVSEFVQLVSAFVYSLKHQLRGTDPKEDLQIRLTAEQFSIAEESKYKPAIMMRLMAEWVKQARSENRIDSIQQSRFDENFDKLADVVGAVSGLSPHQFHIVIRFYYIAPFISIAFVTFCFSRFFRLVYAFYCCIYCLHFCCLRSYCR